MKAKIVYNPQSGKRKLQPQMSYVVEQLSSAGYRNIQVYPTKAVGDAAEAAYGACAESCDLLIAVGGDGTTSEVVSGLVRYRRNHPDHSQIPTLGCIPSGTANDFTSALRIPNDVRKALQIITKGHRAHIDIGSVGEQRSFNYVIAAGAFTRLTYTTPNHLKRFLGGWAYFKDFFREIPLISKPFRLQLSIDGQQISGKYVIALILNSPNFAGMRGVMPDSCMDDGIFDILLLPKSNPRVFFSAIHGMALGVNENINESGIQYLRGKQIVIETEKRLDWNIDGELGSTGSTSEKGLMEIACLNKYLPIMVPALALRKVLFHQPLPTETPAGKKKNKPVKQTLALVRPPRSGNNFQKND
ncbi:MAG: YegS/Rv2252/BmrU family lipid kinase [Spirochaetota bacterium]